VVEPVEAVEEEVERERELGVVITGSEGATVGDREGHLDDVGMGSAELALELGGRRRIEVPGIVEERLREPEQAAADDGANWRSDDFQPTPSALSGISLITASTMPSSRSSLLRTCV
jgi:hypothetical protein